MLQVVGKWILVGVLEKLLDLLKDYLKIKEAEKKIKKEAKGKTADVKKIKDRSERLKRLNDIINT